MVQLSHLYMTTGKTIALTLGTFVIKVMSLVLNTLSRLATAFLAKSKCLLISWLKSPTTVILEHKKIKSVTASTFFPFSLPWSDGTRCHDLSFLNDKFFFFFWMLSFNQLFHSLLSPSSRGSLVPLHFLPLGWYHLHICGFLYFPQQSSF